MKPLLTVLLLAFLGLVPAKAAELIVMTTGGRSMVPVLPVKRVHVVVDKVHFSELKADDVVIYKHSRWGLTTHRLFRKMGERSWWAKGDANHLPDDEYVTPENYVGRLALIVTPEGNFKP